MAEKEFYSKKMEVDVEISETFQNDLENDGSFWNDEASQALGDPSRNRQILREREVD